VLAEGRLGEDKSTMASQQIEQLRTRFNRMSELKKGQFIVILKKKLQGSKNAEYIDFLDECVQRYDVEVRSASQRTSPGVAPSPRGRLRENDSPEHTSHVQTKNRQKDPPDDEDQLGDQEDSPLKIIAFAALLAVIVIASIGGAFVLVAPSVVSPQSDSINGIWEAGEAGDACSLFVGNTAVRLESSEITFSGNSFTWVDIFSYRRVYWDGYYRHWKQLEEDTDLLLLKGSQEVIGIDDDFVFISSTTKGFFFLAEDEITIRVISGEINVIPFTRTENSLLLGLGAGSNDSILMKQFDRKR
jgi:hypothetical protein